MNAVDFPLPGEPPDSQTLLAPEVVCRSLALSGGVSEDFTAQERSLELLRHSMSEFRTAVSITLPASIADGWQVDLDWLLGVHPRPGHQVGFLTHGTTLPQLLVVLLTPAPGEVSVALLPDLLRLAVHFKAPASLSCHRVPTLVDTGDPAQLRASREPAFHVSATHPAEVRHQASPPQWSTDEFSEFHQLGAAD